MIRLLGLRKLVVAAAAACIMLATYLVAGQPTGVGRGYTGQSSANSGPGFGPDNNPGMLGSQASDASGNPGFGPQNNPGTEGSQFGRSTAAQGGANGTDASEFGRSTAAEAGTNGAEHRNTDASFIGKGRNEEIVETHNNTGDEKSKTGETESSEHRSEKSEVSKKFESSLIFAGITPIPSATPGGAGRPKEFGPTNNPGLDHMSQQGLQSSEFGRTTAQNAIDRNGPSTPDESPKPTPPGHHFGWEKGKHNPHASPSASVTTTSVEPEASVSPIPSATPGGPQGFGPTNNPGLDHMSQQGLQSSESGRDTAQNAIDQKGQP